METIRKGSTDFISYYESLCAIQSTYPVPSIRNCAEEGVLNCHLYRLKRLDWHPVLTALRANRIIHTVVFYDKWEDKAQYYFNNEIVRARLPLRLINKSADNETINEIIRSVRPFLSHSQSVTSLLLEGLALDVRNIKHLAKGLEKNDSLKWLSLKGSGVGDRGVEILCQVMKHLHFIEWIDFTWCELTSNAMNVLADLIRYHSLHRQSSVWKDSLRGGHFPSHSNSLSGLRRVTLNLNPNIRDSGVNKLVHALEDDVWIKALDMQSCGLTSASAQLFQTLIQNNTGLVVLDIRENALMDDDEVDIVMELLAHKNLTTNPQEEHTYKWLDIEIHRIQQELKTAGVPIHKKRRKKPPLASADCVRRKGLPWRTAVRNSQRWKNSLPRSVSAHSERISTSVVPLSSSSTSCTNDELPAVQVTLTLEQFRQLQSEVQLCHLELREKEQLRLQMKTRLEQLEEENKSLKQVKIKEDRLKNDQTLQNIEVTFKQFNAFLDLLNEKGYSHLTRLLKPV